MVLIDQHLGLQQAVLFCLVLDLHFDLLNWYATRAHDHFTMPAWTTNILQGIKLPWLFGYVQCGLLVVIQPNVMDILVETPSGLQHNFVTTHDCTWILPKLLIIAVKINGQSGHALLNSRLLIDFLSLKIVCQLNIDCTELAMQLLIQMAVQGLHVKVSASCKATLQYQQVCKMCTFDVINLQNYNMILGSLFIH